MARNRMIKPEFWSSETLIRVSLGSNLLFIGIWNYCDDYGVILDSNRQLLGDIFPFRTDVKESDILQWKNELIRERLLLPIKYNNKSFLVVRSWEEHQKVPNRSMHRMLPGTEQARLISVYLESNESLICKTETETERETETETETERERENKSASRTLFKIPSLAEIEQYKLEISSYVDEVQFRDFYEAKGWMIGKTKMRDWKAALRNWGRREKKDSMSDRERLKAKAEREEKENVKN